LTQLKIEPELFGTFRRIENGRNMQILGIEFGMSRLTPPCSNGTSDAHAERPQDITPGGKAFSSHVASTADRLTLVGEPGSSTRPR
jgi:hypothetical protein